MDIESFAYVVAADPRLHEAKAGIKTAMKDQPAPVDPHAVGFWETIIASVIMMIVKRLIDKKCPPENAKEQLHELANLTDRGKLWERRAQREARRELRAKNLPTEHAKIIGQVVCHHAKELRNDDAKIAQMISNRKFLAAVELPGSDDDSFGEGLEDDDDDPPSEEG